MTIFRLIIVAEFFLKQGISIGLSFIAVFPATPREGSLELHPVEQCWNQVKGVGMATFTSRNKSELEENLYETTDNINCNKQLLAAFFKHAIRFYF